MHKKYLALFAILSFIMLIGTAYASEDNVIITKPGTTIQFSASTFFPDVNIVNASWNFGDGNSGSGLSVSHSYSEGTYLLDVNAMDDQNDTQSSTRKIITGDWISYYGSQADFIMFIEEMNPAQISNLII